MREENPSKIEFIKSTSDWIVLESLKTIVYYLIILIGKRKSFKTDSNENDHSSYMGKFARCFII